MGRSARRARRESAMEAAARRMFEVHRARIAAVTVVNMRCAEESTGHLLTQRWAAHGPESASGVGARRSARMRRGGADMRTTIR